MNMWKKKFLHFIQFIFGCYGFVGIVHFGSNSFWSNYLLNQTYSKHKLCFHFQHALNPNINFEFTDSNCIGLELTTYRWISCSSSNTTNASIHTKNVKFWALNWEWNDWISDEILLYVTYIWNRWWRDDDRNWTMKFIPLKTFKFHYSIWTSTSKCPLKIFAFRLSGKMECILLAWR